MRAPPPTRHQCVHHTCYAHRRYGNKKKGWPTTDTAEDCEAMCKSNTTCTKGTWHSRKKQPFIFTRTSTVSKLRLALHTSSHHYDVITMTHHYDSTL